MLAAEVAGGSVGDSLLVHAWRGGVPLTEEPLTLSAWSLDWSGTPAAGRLSCQVADPDGVLAPWGMGDALAPGGSRLQVTYRFGTSGTTVPIGWFRIRNATPVEQWRTYTTAGVVRRVSGGGSVTVSADDETASVLLDRLDPGARVPVASTVLAEVARLVEDYMAVSVLGGVTDLAIPSGHTYDEGRLDAVVNLLGMVGATYRMAGEQVMEVVPTAGVPSGWVVEGGEEGALIGLTRSLSDDGVYNAVISTGESDSGAPLVGRAYIETGVLAWEESYGRVPVFHQAIATTAAGVQQDAQTHLASRQTAGEVELAVECLTHPGIQLHDLVTVVAATEAGSQPLVGRVTSMRMGSAVSDAGTTPSIRMGLTVAVPRDTLEMIARRVSRAR
jgi:hypothetical protein